MGELSGKKVFVVEDDTDIRELVRINLNLDGAECTLFSKGEELIGSLNENLPDLVVLDLMLPGVGGLELCRWIRGNESTKKLPIVMLTAKTSDEDIVAGLELGADDYVTKPFSPQVLMARIKAVLKRMAPSEEAGGDSVKRHGIEIHPGRHQVLVDGAEVDLRNVEFKILHFLIQRPGWVFTRTQLVDAVHGDNYAVTDRSIDFQMVGLRKKLGNAGQYIETVRGVGYRFSE